MAIIVIFSQNPHRLKLSEYCDDEDSLDCIMGYLSNNNVVEKPILVIQYLPALNTLVSSYSKIEFIKTCSTFIRQEQIFPQTLLLEELQFVLHFLLKLELLTLVIWEISFCFLVMTL